MSKDTYEGKTAKQIWTEWSYDQRLHFWNDHSDLITDKLNIITFGKGLGEMENLLNTKYDELPLALKEIITEHISDGSYKKGGEAKGGKGYKRFKGGVKVRLDEAFLNDESNQSHDVTAIATVIGEPRDEEDDVQIQYESGTIDHVNQEWLEPIGSKSLGGVLVGAGLGIAGTLGYQNLKSERSGTKVQQVNVEPAKKVITEIKDLPSKIRFYEPKGYTSISDRIYEAYEPKFKKWTKISKEKYDEYFLYADGEAGRPEYVRRKKSEPMKGTLDGKQFVWYLQEKMAKGGKVGNKLSGICWIMTGYSI